MAINITNKNKNRKKINKDYMRNKKEYAKILMRVSWKKCASRKKRL